MVNECKAKEDMESKGKDMESKAETIKDSYLVSLHSSVPEV